ncbi:MAG: thioesterase family protein, partial [Ilumatobacter fluminis]
MSEFEQATTVTPRGDGSYDATIHEGWDIMGNANGGYLIALAARAMGDAVERPPLSLTAHYLLPGRVGPVTVDTEVVRAGRRMAVVRGTVVSPEHGPVMALLGTFADQPDAERAGPSVVDAAPPDLPPFDECVPAGPPVAMN